MEKERKTRKGKTFTTIFGAFLRSLIMIGFFGQVSVAEIPFLKWPLQGTLAERTISLDFGADWIYGECPVGVVKKHAGIDISATLEENVYAPEAGVVKAVVFDGEWKYCVTIEHSGFTTVCWHINPLVNVENSVVRGQIIGTIADISPHGIHLHFGVRDSNYSNISNRGALPQNDCDGDPGFPEYFVDPETLSYSYGTGTPENPYQIATKADLLALAANTADYNKCFILTADIDMEGRVFTTAIIAPDIDNSNFNIFDGTAFTGTFDGNSHKITHFIINDVRNDFLGLFGYIGSGGSIKNLGLENITITGSGDCSQYGDCCWCLGGLVGQNCGTISNCYSTGTVSGSSSEVGGLIGYNYNGTISNCYSMAAVSGFYYIGGLVGYNYNGTISNCYSMAAVSGTSNSYYVGGLVGYTWSGSYTLGGSISNCYSTGSVSGSQYVGGLVGYEYFSSISRCYSTGAVSGIVVGGLVGYSDGFVVDSFWDIQTSGQTTSHGGVGKTTAEMKTLSTFTSAGWNFTTIWAICEGTNYPRLQWQIPVVDWVCPDGVNFEDLDYSVQRWLLTDCTLSNNYCDGADIDKSGVVDLVDFAIFAQHWLQQ